MNEPLKHANKIMFLMNTKNTNLNKNIFFKEQENDKNERKNKLIMKD